MDAPSVLSCEEAKAEEIRGCPKSGEDSLRGTKKTAVVFTTAVESKNFD